MGGTQGMQDVVVKTNEKQAENIIIQLIRQGEPVQRIISILHVSEATVDSVMDRYVMGTMF